MISKKVCMLGAFSVGKTSLIKRFVESIFSEKYKTTIGVQISKKRVQHNGREFQLMLWDIEGADDFIDIKPRFLSGAAGCLLVVDGTRPKTAKVVDRLHRILVEVLGEDAPFCLVLNKMDLQDQWQIDDVQMRLWKERGWQPIKTSAKSGIGVEEAFYSLVEKMDR